MINNLLTWLFQKTELGKAVDGNKKYIGLVMSAWAVIIAALAWLAGHFPDIAFLPEWKDALSAGFTVVAQFLGGLGISFYLAGDIGDVLKEKNSK